MPPKRDILSEGHRRKVDGAITEGKKPSDSRRGSSRLLLQTGVGKKYVELADARGKLTTAGKYYFEKTGEPVYRSCALHLGV